MVGMCVLAGLFACAVENEQGDRSGIAVPSIDEDRDGFESELDCDDHNEAIHPGAIERCDGLDNDCDGLVDDHSVDATTYFLDRDGDGYGDHQSTKTACSLPPGYALQALDCDDHDPVLHPETVWYLDRDNDGFGDDVLLKHCEQPYRGALQGGDCDDSNHTRHPGATEICDNLDNDCNGLTDDDPIDPKAFYADLDGDGYGDPNNIVETCWLGEGVLRDATDCDDTNPAISPAAEEVCDEIDHDCSGRPDNTCNNQGVDAATVVFDGYGARDFGDALANLGDLDGDGADELLVSSAHADDYDGIAFLIAGDSEGGEVVSSAAATLSPQVERYFGTNVSPLPDVDGDGFRDFAVYSKYATNICYSCGSLAVFSGWQEGAIDAGDANLLLSLGVTYGEYGFKSVGGDLTGDGVADLALSAPGLDTFAGAVYILEGPVTEESEPVATYAGSGRLEMAGSDLGDPTDLNGDGFVDLTVGSMGASSYYGEVTVVFGPLDGEYDRISADVQISGDRGDYLGNSVHSGGDLDGDGYPELVAASPDGGTEAVYVFSDLSGTMDVSDAIAVIGAGGGSELGRSIDVADVDLDGKGDLLLNNPTSGGLAAEGGAVLMFYGHLKGARDARSADLIYFGDDESAHFGRASTFVDYNGDGLMDIAGTQGGWGDAYDEGLYIFEQ